MDQNWLDIQHRGFCAYQEQTEHSESCQALTRALSVAPQGTESVDTVLLDCLVCTDWIEQIEEALPHLENALRQNRQFILRQGETVPIEKAKRVSRESVIHLSRHSELISSDPQTPERIYISENVDTFTVYENRFLYMLLRYVQEFTGIRYQKITALAGAYSSDISFARELTHGNRQIRFRLDFSETSHGPAKPETNEILLRLRAIVQTVETLLRTDLMKEVAGTPLLKPPIARTNVLMHDPDFRRAFELYSYLTAYNAQGFEPKELFRQQGKAPKQLQGDLSNLAAITSYLAYRMSMQEELESRRQEAIVAENRQKLAALRAALGEISPAVLAYIQGLEQQLAALEQKNQKLQGEISAREAAEAELAAVKTAMQALQGENAKLCQQLLAKNQEIQALNRQNGQLQETTQMRLQQAELQLEKLERRHEEKLEQQRLEFQKEYEALGEKYRLACALSRDFSDTHSCTKEEFGELEQQFEAFRRYYRQQWKLTKKQIRKEQLWNK